VGRVSLANGMGARSAIPVCGVVAALLSGNGSCSLFYAQGVIVMAISKTPKHPSIFSHQEWKKICRSLNLSARQEQIVTLLLEGHKTFNAARVLGISPDTVRAHLRRLYLKLEISDRLELMTCCVREFRRLYDKPNP